MSVIQSIREKYAKWAVVAIALALLGFILTDYFQAQSRMGGGSTTIGVVNGKKIDYNNFQARLQAAEERAQMEAEQMQREFTEADRHQTNERLWNSDVEEIIMSSEFKKVGIEVGRKEFNDYLFGENPPMDLRQRFTNEQGVYDVAAVRNAINQMRKDAKQRDDLNIYLAAIEYGRKLEKYNSLLTNSVYYPKWYIEKQNSEAAALAKASYVKSSYLKIPDSTITVSDKEIEEYVNKRKEQFRQEESRSIAYVVFDASPTAADSAVIKKQVEERKAEFATDTMTAKFLSRYGSTTSFSDVYRNKAQLQSSMADSIIRLSKNEVYGPYLEGNTYALAKMIDKRDLPDSVYCRHILIRTSGEGAIPDSIAEKRLDSAIAVISGGANFVQVMKQVSMDQAANTQDSLGIMRFSSDQIQNAQNFDQDFAKYILFDGTKGQRKKIKTQFGYHYIEIVDQKNIQPNYKVAYFSKNIIASRETERKALEEANKFANESKDLKSFDANVTKLGYRKLEAANIKPNDIYIQGISIFGPSRSLVREIYKADKGDVLKQERVGDLRVGYRQIVAVVTDVLEEGVQPARVARAGTASTPSVERILKDKKKAEQIKQKLGKITTLEAAASILQDSIVTIDSLRFTDRNIRDPKVIGAIFNTANKGKVVPEALAGSDGVYVVRVDDITTTSVMTGDIESQRAQMRRMGMNLRLQGQAASPIMIMKKIAKIKDNRRNFY